jgi:tRNA threonylcarbamoyl adenosine modification protein YeaZ
MSCALALHSCSSTFGVAVLDGNGRQHSAAFPLGRDLANGLFSAIAELLPVNQWPQLSWIAVAIGPGSFTGTRISLVLARTLAQQLDIPLYGWGSYELIAHRRQGELRAQGPHWIGQTLVRRGVVAGYYSIGADAVQELEPPRLYPNGVASFESPFWEAQMEPQEDSSLLLKLATGLYESATPGPWQQVLPLYPTSPVQNSEVPI